MELINWNLVTVVAVIFSAITFLHAYKISKEIKEDKVKEYFLKHEIWSSEGDTDGNDTNFFNLNITTPSDHIFSGDITSYDAELRKYQLVFYFGKVNGDKITLAIRETTGYVEFGSAQAKLKMIHPELFQIRFSKGYGFGKDRFMPNLPRKTLIFPEKVESNQSGMPTKVLTNGIIHQLSPERNYAKAKELLGLPDKVSRAYPVFEDDMYSDIELENAISDLYLLKNAALKVTTIDKQSIHSITVFSYDNKIELLGPFYPCEMDTCIVGEAKICKELLEVATIEPIRTMRDSAIALQTYSGSPFYKYMTYFIEGDGGLGYGDNPNYNDLIGNVITGFCYSSSKRVFYIYDSEIMI